MESLFWQLANRTPETQFIFDLFHSLLAGLTLLVLLHRFRGSRSFLRMSWADRILPLSFLLLVVHFALLSVYFGVQFFFHKELEWAGLEALSQGLMACAVLVMIAGYLQAAREQERHWVRWMLRGCTAVAGIALADLFYSSKLPAGEGLHSAGMLINDLIVLLGLVLGLRAVLRTEWEGRQATVIALASIGVAVLLHNVFLFLPFHAGILAWNAEEHLLSVALLAFAWAAGERSRNLLDRVFVRLNLTFIVLASLIMLITAGMEKYQYFRLSEERSMDLAEFLRGHVLYYREQGDSLAAIFQRPQVLRRVVVEFGRLPELRTVNVYLDGQRATLRYTPDWEIQQEIMPLAAGQDRDTGMQPPGSFRMIRLPLQDGNNLSNRIEFISTMDYINQYIGKYIILIYSLFTIVVGVASVIIGIIVTDTDRRLRRQYEELQETQQQLAQAAKLASIGELTGGMAHEINTPITSILALASHLSEGRSSATLPPSQRQSLEVIVQQAQRVAKIVGNLLTFSRQSRLELGRVEVPELLETAIALVQHCLKNGDIRLLREIDPGCPKILGDAGRLTEVFVNLLNNAVDSMPTGGTLAVRAFGIAEYEGGVRIEVSDTGCGIPPENLGRIFDPFFTTKEPGKGTGLGLSISHGIVKDHGGRIWTHSQFGAGARFIVILPKGGDWK
jgi:signal transduction histidine kinase